MLTLKLLREQPEFVVERLAVKNFDASGIVEQILEQDSRRRSCQTELDAALSAQKIKAKEIGKLMQQGRKEEAEAAKKEVAAMKEKSKALEAEMDECQRRQDDLLVLLPNLPDRIVPEGRNADDNVVVRMGGDIPELPETALPHWELASKYDIIDFDLGVNRSAA